MYRVAREVSVLSAKGGIWSPVYTIQPVVKPVVKPVWQPVWQTDVSCIQPVVSCKRGLMNNLC